MPPGRAGRRWSNCIPAAMPKRAGRSGSRELDRLRRAARHASDIGLVVHAGHGLDYHNVQHVAAIPQIVELNIGHAIIGRALFSGLDAAVREMKALMLAAR